MLYAKFKLDRMGVRGAKRVVQLRLLGWNSAADHQVYGISNIPVKAQSLMGLILKIQFLYDR